MVLFKEKKLTKIHEKYSNNFVLTYSYQFYDTVTNLEFCDFSEQGEGSRCSQNSGKICCTCNILVKPCIISSFFYSLCLNT